MRVNVVSYARLRELLGEKRSVWCDDGTSAGGLWKVLTDLEPRLEAFAASTRLARNGRILSDSREILHEGDDVTLLPPVGGG
ncbi:MAG: MoaD/ThiS family protein [Candidatus Eremiobacteraeota bacterium]|nr:MoaD/ThiS family protein [Candidatus Eremiobacteraeota bacterium]